MKRLWFLAATLLVVAGLVGWYYASAWNVARGMAVAIAAGDRPAPYLDAPWTLGSGLEHDRLDVKTHPGWIEPTRHLALAFTITDSESEDDVEFAVDVEFAAGRWRVTGVGAGG